MFQQEAGEFFCLHAHRVHEGVAAISIYRIGIRPLLQKMTEELRVSSHCSKQQRSCARFALGINMGALAQQKLCQMFTPPVRGMVERSISVDVAHVGICAVFKQNTDRLCLPGFGGNQERRETLSILLIDISSGLD